MAAGGAYYAVFSLFLLVLGSIAVASFFVGSEEAQSRLVSFLAEQVPGLSAFLKDNVSGVVRARGAISIVSLVGLFCSGRAVLGAVHRVVNRAWGSLIRPISSNSNSASSASDSASAPSSYSRPSSAPSVASSAAPICSPNLRPSSCSGACL